MTNSKRPLKQLWNHATSFRSVRKGCCCDISGMKTPQDGTVGRLHNLYSLPPQGTSAISCLRGLWRESSRTAELPLRSRTRWMEFTYLGGGFKRWLFGIFTPIKRRNVPISINFRNICVFVKWPGYNHHVRICTWLEWRSLVKSADALWLAVTTPPRKKDVLVLWEGEGFCEHLDLWKIRYLHLVGLNVW